MSSSFSSFTFFTVTPIHTFSPTKAALRIYQMAHNEVSIVVRIKKKINETLKETLKSVTNPML